MNVLKQRLFSLHGFGYVFTPPLILSLVFVILLYFLIHLGLWQIHRAEFKKKLEQAYQTQSQLSAQNFDPEKIAPEYSKLKLTGYYDNAHSFLLDNSILNHRVGFTVLTPFILPHFSKLILINRGWIPRAASYKQLPVLKPVEGIQSIEGLVQHFPGKYFVFSENTPSAEWPQLIESLNPDTIQSLLQKPVYSSIILLGPNQPHGFERVWTPNLGMPAQRHVGYAIQWFALALTLVIIYFVLNTRREKHGTPQTK